MTAAYGQFLPKAFLAIPKHGTMNVHPSLLPRWRGAAPLQRSLEAGDAEVGVTVLRTVLKMDAGPVAAQRTRAVEDGDDCAALLDELFGVGAQLLIDDVMPGLWDGSLECAPQDGDLATEAPKLTKDGRKARGKREKDPNRPAYAETAYQLFMKETRATNTSLPKGKEAMVLSRAA